MTQDEFADPRVKELFDKYSVLQPLEQKFKVNTHDPPRSLAPSTFTSHTSLPPSTLSTIPHTGLHGSL